MSKKWSDEEKQNILINVKKDIDGGMTGDEACKKNGIIRQQRYQWTKQLKGNSPSGRVIKKSKSKPSIQEIPLTPQVENHQKLACLIGTAADIANVIRGL